MYLCFYARKMGAKSSNNQGSTVVDLVSQHIQNVCRISSSDFIEEILRQSVYAQYFEKYA